MDIQAELWTYQIVFFYLFVCLSICLSTHIDYIYIHVYIWFPKYIYITQMIWIYIYIYIELCLSKTIIIKDKEAMNLKGRLWGTWEGLKEEGRSERDVVLM